MAVTGIIAEYNPLHNGHRYLIEQARAIAQSDPIIVCLSGNYVQRGEVAMLDKWTRAQLALNMGVDLVVELPLQYAIESADRFAFGAVEILKALGCQQLCFGSEKQTFDYQTAGQKLAVLDQQHFGKINYQQTYATQLSQFYQDYLAIDFNQPNHLLGLSYAKANAQLDEPLKLVPIKRIGSQHDQLGQSQQFASGSQIRQWVKNKQIEPLKTVMPETVMTALKQQPLDWQVFFSFLKYRIQSATHLELKQIHQMSEGLEYRFKAVINQCQTIDDLLSQLKTKRYTYARLRRLCLYVLLNVTDQQMLEAPNFIHVLGFNQKGQQQLAKIKKTSPLPLITKVSAKIGGQTGIMNLQVRADRLIETQLNNNQNFGRQVIFMKKDDE